jgi:hypothetical protein
MPDEFMKKMPKKCQINYFSVEQVALNWDAFVIKKNSSSTIVQ